MLIEAVVHETDVLSKIIGIYDANLKLISDKLSIRVSARGTTLFFQGSDLHVRKARKIVLALEHMLSANMISEQEVPTYITEEINSVTEDPGKRKLVFNGAKKIYTRTENQRKYATLMEQRDVLFTTGPAGTGKTFLAVAFALSLLRRNMVKRIILTRPAVETGEKLGYLPGDSRDKVIPYLRPLFDAIERLLDRTELERYMERGIIEVIPLAYMRGRTFTDTFLIMDEAQNSTFGQMKMFLTRMGHGSKAVATGDVTQIDLSENKDSGLVQAVNVLRDVDSIGFLRFSEQDIMRHPVIQDIINAYKRSEESPKCQN